MQFVWFIVVGLVQDGFGGQLVKGGGFGVCGRHRRGGARTLLGDFLLALWARLSVRFDWLHYRGNDWRSDSHSCIAFYQTRIGTNIMVYEPARTFQPKGTDEQEHDRDCHARASPRSQFGLRADPRRRPSRRPRSRSSSGVRRLLQRRRRSKLMGLSSTMRQRRPSLREAPIADGRDQQLLFEKPQRPRRASRSPSVRST